MSRVRSKLEKGLPAKKASQEAGVFKLVLEGGAHLKRLSAHAPWGLANRSEYQRRICELEMELSRVREEMDDLRCAGGRLESTKQYYTELYQSSPVAHLSLDLLGKVSECNSAFLSLIEMTAKPA